MSSSIALYAVKNKGYLKGLLFRLFDALDGAVVNSRPNRLSVQHEFAFVRDQVSFRRGWRAAPHGSAHRNVEHVFDFERHGEFVRADEHRVTDVDIATDWRGAFTHAT